MDPIHLKYTENHEWVRDDGGVYVAGITAHAAEQLGDITYVELPEVGEELTRNQDAATVESVKAASEVYAPVGGRVVEVNLVLNEHPEIINKSPYDDGWFFKLDGINIAEYDALMTAAEYDAFLKAL